MRLPTLLAALLFANTALSADSPCTVLLEGGVFDRRQTNSSEGRYELFRSIFCRDEASSEQQGRQLAATVNIPLDLLNSIMLGGSTASSNYSAWRSTLCENTDRVRREDIWRTETVQTASQAILDAFTRCIQQRGLVSYVELSRDPSQFIWNFRFDSSTPRVREAEATLSYPDNVTCKLNNNTRLPSTLKIKTNGLTLVCQRDRCKDATLVINGDPESSPSRIFLFGDSAPPPPEPPPSHTVGPFSNDGNGAPDMKGPFTMALPENETCKLLRKEGAWHPHCPNKNDKLDCPDPDIKNGAAYVHGYDDKAYDDNCGRCTYTFTCQGPTPPDTGANHPCRAKRHKVK